MEWHGGEERSGVVWSKGERAGEGSGVKRCGVWMGVEWDEEA